MMTNRITTTIQYILQYYHIGRPMHTDKLFTQKVVLYSCKYNIYLSI